MLTHREWVRVNAARGRCPGCGNTSVFSFYGWYGPRDGLSSDGVQPCLICGRTPAHIRAQMEARSMQRLLSHRREQ